MDPARWERINALFAEALERPTDQRAAFLDQASKGDPSLRQEVEELLASDETASRHRFLEQESPILNAELANEIEGGLLTDQDLGSRLGPYELGRCLGVGGMGRVYLAERVEGYREEVAIKFLARMVADNQVAARFRNEIQIQATLGVHPNIARLLDASAQDGHLYFVMEFVDGDRIDVHCNSQRLDIEARLKLLLVICDALSFAHRHAVIHRDLKPSNILVTKEGVPKLIDFGIAKLLDSESGLEGVFSLTGTAGRVLTPTYGSPEQFRGEPPTTATDVYSLGVVLYELLTGQSPYQTTGQSYSAIERQVLEEDPEPPSAVVGRKSAEKEDDPTEVAAARSSTISKMKRRLSGDLDTIVLNALRKEPSRRYATVDALADDIRRYLDGLPIVARKDATGYRLRKFVFRHRLGVAAAILLIVTLVGGITGTTIGMVRAFEARDRAERSFLQSVRAVDEVMTEVAENELLNLPYMQPVRKRIYEASLPYYLDFVEQRSDDPELRTELVEAHRRLALINELIGSRSDAADHNLEAIALLRSIIRTVPASDVSSKSRLLLSITLNDLGLNLNRIEGESTAAEQCFQEAIALQERLIDDHPNSIDPRRRLGNSLTNYGILLSQLGRSEEAASILERGITIGERLIALEPDDRVLRFELAQRLQELAVLEFFYGLNPDQGVLRQEEAAKLFAEVREARPSVPEYVYKEASCLSNLGLMYRVTGRSEEARSVIEQAVAFLDRLSQEYASVVDYRVGYGIALNMLSDLQRADGEFDAAMTSTSHARELEVALVREHPEVSIYRVNLSKSHNNIGRLEQARGHDQAALQGFEQAAEILESISQLSPNDKYNLACNFSLCASVAEPDSAALFADRAVAILREAVDSGYINVGIIEGDHDLDSIRTHPQYIEMVERLNADLNNQ